MYRIMKLVGLVVRKASVLKRTTTKQFLTVPEKAGQLRQQDIITSASCVDKMVGVTCSSACSTALPGNGRRVHSVRSTAHRRGHEDA